MGGARLGVDWGTHSSKWCYQGILGQAIVGQIWDSTIWRTGDHLVLYPLTSYYESGFGERGIKRRIIDDTDQPFWEGTRRRLGVTLGEAVVFSLFALLRDAFYRINARKREIPKHICFSHPNWVDAHSQSALQNFREAVAIAVSSFAETESGPHVDDSIHMAIEEVRGLVKRNFDRRFVHGNDAGGGRFTWSLMFESCAAGLPYLSESEPELFDGGTIPTNRFEQSRKFLVVDIGAGSTDVGYMLRVIKPNPVTGKPDKPALLWTKAAPAFERAGNWLTDKIFEEWTNRGDKRTKEEAEIYKTSGATDWYQSAYVADWCESIAQRVENYARTIIEEDSRYIRNQAPLHIILTGGSSAVSPIERCLETRLSHLLSAFCRARVLRAPIRSFSAVEGYNRERFAQLAVCVGASHPHAVDLKPL